MGMIFCVGGGSGPFFLARLLVSAGFELEAVREGRVKRGDLLACCGFGAGLTWGGRAPDRVALGWAAWSGVFRLAG